MDNWNEWGFLKIIYPINFEATMAFTNSWIDLQLNQHRVQGFENVKAKSTLLEKEKICWKLKLLYEVIQVPIH